MVIKVRAIALLQSISVEYGRSHLVFKCQPVILLWVDRIFKLWVGRINQKSDRALSRK
ncbi:hypothetical protein NDI37_06490 [Funiculus sociatus GB2-A5]|uniref:Uncharacterized protein n=1 Tax=Funiculus sociatus GB2-A5 TaxID=2933946 RepID=A0ABV0JN62_9CYAN|nr:MULTISPECIES: hypothetical protein [unclassified Trichocoleus]MBD1905703.1 hypothetical protein [Trichocoleus sp. FACHB-832]MBD2065843.1 hypothetical protein [Trichocoleus sp. FACHB-6]